MHVPSTLSQKDPPPENIRTRYSWSLGCTDQKGNSAYLLFSSLRCHILKYILQVKKQSVRYYFCLSLWEGRNNIIFGQSTPYFELTYSSFFSPHDMIPHFLKFPCLCLLNSKHYRRGGTVGKKCKKFNQKDAGETICWYKLGASQQNNLWPKETEHYTVLNIPLTSSINQLVYQILEICPF